MTPPQTKLYHFAQLLSQDLPLAVIATRMGMTVGGAKAMLARIRKGLGPQAV